MLRTVFRVASLAAMSADGSGFVVTIDTNKATTRRAPFQGCVAPLLAKQQPPPEHL